MNTRPRIACFHGGGSNKAIFRAQCHQLQKELEHEFELVYFNAPFESRAGPDVLPAFSSYAPFRSWFMANDEGERTDGSGYDKTGNDGLERVLEMMRAIEPPGEWVAAMGFSQGTRVVGGLLLDQQRRSESIIERESAMLSNLDLKFGVLCVGGGAPMLSSLTKAANSSPFDTAPGSGNERITIPTLHYHGLRDINLTRGRSVLKNYYDPSSVTLWELDYHHAMPWIKEHNLELARLIRQMYHDTRGYVEK